jgi:hypothetical protein
MVNYTDSAWAGRQDTHNRSHVPAQPLWHFILRIAQLVLALLVLILTAYSAGQFGSGDVRCFPVLVSGELLTDFVQLAGFGLAWFTFILTVGYLVWLGVSIFINPSVYNYWAQLYVLPPSAAVECIVVAMSLSYLQHGRHIPLTNLAPSRSPASSSGCALGPSSPPRQPTSPSLTGTSITTV